MMSVLRVYVLMEPQTRSHIADSDNILGQVLDVELHQLVGSTLGNRLQKHIANYLVRNDLH